MKFEEINQYNINYLTDESRLKGTADYIIFCETEDDVKNAVKEAGKRGFGITVQGARTGITGGAVPVRDGNEGTAANTEGDSFSRKKSSEGKRLLSVLKGAAVLNLGKMKQVLSILEAENGYRIKAGPGLTLTEIEGILKGEVFDVSLLDDESKQNLDKIKKRKYFFPPDPIEKSASIGGVCANCASGSRSFYYGSARKYITSLDIVLADSSDLHLERGGIWPEYYNSGGSHSDEGLPDYPQGCEFHDEAAQDGKPLISILNNEQSIKGDIPELYKPDCKNAAGLYSVNDMDLIDLFVGSEGILGIIASVEFLVIPEPAFVSGILIFPSDIKINLDLSEYFKSLNSDSSFIGVKTAAVEYFDRNALSLVSAYIKEGLFKNLFPFSENNRGGALYVEFHSGNKDSGERILESIYIELRKRGIDENAVFVSDGEGDLLRMKDFRHSVPESVNMTIDRIRKQGNDITKLGTDLAVPDKYFRELFNIYCRDLETSGLESAVFGHIGNSHLHVNILPRNIDEYKKGKQLVKKWVEKAVSMRGSVSAEHGTGRLKKEYLEMMYGKEELEKIAYIKSLFDPGYVLNRGVMI